MSDSPAADPSPPLTHFDADGSARMVDVGGKPVTTRVAIAEAVLTAAPETLERIRGGSIEKGDVLAVARLAGIMGAKRTADLIPLCHPLPLESATVSFEFVGETTLRIVAKTHVAAKTGVEMEALTAVTTACLTLYDMLKAAQKDMRIEGVRLVLKDGGKSGRFEA